MSEVHSVSGAFFQPLDFEERLRNWLIGPIVICEVCDRSVDPRDVERAQIPTDDPGKSSMDGHARCVKAWYEKQKPRRLTADHRSQPRQPTFNRRKKPR